MCGLPCSGKTTLAKQIEVERAALRLTPDEWITRLFGTDVTEEVDAAREPVESMMWDIAARLLVLGVDVILDFGFWAREERDDYRRRAELLGARTEVHYSDVAEDALLARLAERNIDLPIDTFRIDESMLRRWLNVFEPPSEDEFVEPGRG